MAAAFASWLGDPVARLEGGIAAAQRAHRPLGRGWRRAPGGEVVSRPEGLLGWWQPLHAELIGHPEGPVAALLQRSAPVRPPERGAEHWLLQKGATGVQISGLSEALADFLAGAELAPRRAHLEALRSLGAEPATTKTP